MLKTNTNICFLLRVTKTVIAWKEEKQTAIIITYYYPQSFPSSKSKLSQKIRREISKLLRRLCFLDFISAKYQSNNRIVRINRSKTSLDGLQIVFICQFSWNNLNTYSSHKMFQSYLWTSVVFVYHHGRK